MYVCVCGVYVLELSNNYTINVTMFICACTYMYIYNYWGERSESYLVESTAALSVYTCIYIYNYIYIYRYVFDVRHSGLAPRYVQT